MVNDNSLASVFGYSQNTNTTSNINITPTMWSSSAGPILAEYNRVVPAAWSEPTMRAAKRDPLSWLHDEVDRIVELGRLDD